MFNTKSILAATFIAAMISAPALAIEVAADAMLGASPEDMTTVKMIEDSAFIGNEVRTKDQIVIGLVDGVFESADKGSFALVAIKSDIAAQSSVKTFTVPLSADMVSDGALTLAFTEAELFVALSGDLAPASN